MATIEQESPAVAHPEAVVEGLPPGPRLPKAVQTVLVWALTPWWIPRLRRRHGDVFTVRAAPSGTVVHVADPEHVAEVFRGPTDIFHAGEGNALLEPVLGARSVLVLDEAEHLRERRLMLPAFHGERIARLTDVMRRTVEDDVARWPVGEALRLHPRFQALTLDIILRVVIGVDDPRRAAVLRPALRHMVDLRTWHLALWLRPELAAVPPWRGLRRRIEAARALLVEEIATRRRAGDAADRDDVLSMLLQARTEDGEPLDDEGLRDELVTLLLAGHETTAVALSWMFERVLRHPDVLARLRDGLEDDRDPYRDAVVKETLRARPVIFEVARKLTRPAVVAGHRLPAGVVVLPSIGLLAGDERLFPEPTAFRPERWLGDDAPPSYAWIPFGGGPRRCLGAAFAHAELTTALRAILRAVDLRADRPAPERQRMHHITIVPSRGARAVVTARRA